MSEESAIRNTPFPQTRKSLTRDLEALGVGEGMTLLVHSSLGKIGWVSGGPVAVVQALMDSVTEKGTVIMPTFSTDYSNPENWQHPPVPKEWVQTIRESMPAYNPEYTPTREMGRIPECFRDFPGVTRSNHPLLSFAAWGRNKDFLIRNHQLDYPLGETSPLGRIYDLDGYVLLLGVSYDKNTSFHLAEYRTGIRKEISCELPVTEEGKRIWKVCRDIEICESDFVAIGEDLEREIGIKKGCVGMAESRLFSMRKAVDFAAAWFRNRIG